MSNQKLTAAMAMFFLIGASSCCSLHKKEAARSLKKGYATEDLAQYADPMSGTGGNANCFPGAVAPFGMIQWSPDTGNGQHKGGYYCDDTSISDFSLDHLSGVGCTYGEDFAMMPFMGALPTLPLSGRGEFASGFSHGNESVRPGYYGVSLDNGIKVELTTTARSGFGRITYPSGSATSIMINAASDINRSEEAAIYIDPDHREISGWSVGGFFCHGRERDHDQRKVYFCEVFDRPFAAWSAWSNDTLTKGATAGSGNTAGAYITFNTGNDRTVSAKVAISYVGIDNARGNIKTESPLTEFSSADFDKTAEKTHQIWNDRLNKIQVSGGTPEARKTFYSMLYHALVGPCIVSDANGQYYGYDAKIHKTHGNRVQYGVFSGWDIYRSECQLLAMIAPKEASDMAQSLLLDYQQGGTFPRWGVATQDSGVMMGDPAAAMIADFYEFGARDFDTKAALAGLVRAANDPSVYSPLAKTHERDALADYLKLGYVPEHQKGGYGNVSMTLEYCSADFALAQFARDLGDMQDYAVLIKRAQNWQNTFNSQSGYVQMRRRNGQWVPGFKNDVNKYDGTTAYVEGTAAQYTWMVPFNLKGLAEKMGGPEASSDRLDHFFTKLNAGDSEYANLGNEPCLNMPWIYDFLGKPWKTQQIVRRETELYSPAYTSYPGNDDVGEMSSWYVFAALGMYPELPGSDALVFDSPIFPKAVLHLPHGDVTIIGHDAAKDAAYVQNMELDGKPSSKLWIHFNQISHGGTVIFDLGSSPNKDWGSDAADAPPSYQ